MKTVFLKSKEEFDLDIFIEYAYLSHIIDIRDDNVDVEISAQNAFFLTINYDTGEKEEISCGSIILEKVNDMFAIKNLVLEERLFNKECLSVIFKCVQNFLCRRMGLSSITIDCGRYTYKGQFDCDVNNTARQLAAVAMQ